MAELCKQHSPQWKRVMPQIGACHSILDYKHFMQRQKYSREMTDKEPDYNCHKYNGKVIFFLPSILGGSRICSSCLSKFQHSIGNFSCHALKNNQKWNYKLGDDEFDYRLIFIFLQYATISSISSYLRHTQAESFFFRNSWFIRI